MSWVDEFVNNPPGYSEPAKPKKTKGKRRPEDILQETVCTFLNHALPKDAWYCSIPNGAVLRGDERQRKIQMSRLKATGLKPGAPDLIMFWSRAAFSFELKTPTGRLSDNQRDVAASLILAGVKHYVITSVDQLQTILLDQEGVPLRARVGSLFR